MTSPPIIPAAVALAARRAFIRTTLQGYEAVLGVGITANGLLALIRGEADLAAVAVTVVIAVIGPPIAGLRSWASILRRGIPDDYRRAALVEHSALDPADRRDDLDRALAAVAASVDAVG